MAINSSNRIPRIDMRLLNATLRNTPALQPQRASDGAAALDLRACIKKPLELAPSDTTMVSSGVALCFHEPGYCGLLMPRSGLGAKNGIVLANTIGLIDSDYTGEIIIAVWNRGNKSYTIKPFCRLCQLLFLPVVIPQFKLVDEFQQQSIRGINGFGSTGVT